MGGNMLSVRKHEQQLLELEAIRRNVDKGELGLFKEAKERVLGELRGGARR